ncbi:MAG: TetR/AcrR family transcriptional regulator [Bacteroidales bacterium]|nr:TetR/AcrR family transcriptional regulator [Bacteroidales bacterium]MBN2762939.1 TetR/AcrR family transcriptional regulator [Bacteroidales bacterium]
MRDRIIETAAEMMLREGYTQVSMKGIADAVGLAKPSLYHYFSGKEELFEAVVDLFFREGGKWTAVFLRPDLSFKEALRQMFGYFTELIEYMDHLLDDRQKGKYGYYYLLVDALRMFGRVREQYEQAYRNDFEIIQKAVKKAIKNKEIREDINWESLAAMLSAMMEGGLMLSTLYPSLNVGQLSEGYFEILWNGIKVQADA